MDPNRLVVKEQNAGEAARAILDPPTATNGGWSVDGRRRPRVTSAKASARTELQRLGEVFGIVVDRDDEHNWIPWVVSHGHATMLGRSTARGQHHAYANAVPNNRPARAAIPGLLDHRGHGPRRSGPVTGGRHKSGTGPCARGASRGREPRHGVDRSNSCERALPSRHARWPDRTVPSASRSSGPPRPASEDRVGSRFTNGYPSSARD